MEQRLFIVACVMYAFSFISKYLFKQKKLESDTKFSFWNAIFIIFFLGSIYAVLNFVLNNGTPAVFAEGLSKKQILVWGGIVLAALGGFWYARKNPTRRTKIIKTNMDWANTLYFAGFVASIVMFFFVQAFKIPSASMYNTLQIGDHLFVNKAVYGVIVFAFPAAKKDQMNCGGYQYGRDYVKRVIALPGDKVEIKDRVLYINDKEEPLHGYEVFKPVIPIAPVVKVGAFLTADEKELTLVSPAVYQTLWEKRLLEHELGLSLRDNFGPVTVPQGQYFAMGDNRDDSCDSRFWGPVPRENIKGTALLIYWPFKRMQLIK